MLRFVTFTKQDYTLRGNEKRDNNNNNNNNNNEDVIHLLSLNLIWTQRDGLFVRLKQLRLSESQSQVN